MRKREIWAIPFCRRHHGKFSKTHPDFGLEGTFFVNLGNRTFGSTGTLAQRLNYLVEKGFELGNHTYSHINLKKDAKTAEIIQREIGGNQKKMYELVPGYTFNAFSLPYGAPSPQLKQYVVEGIFEGVTYHNKAIMEVGAEPLHRRSVSDSTLLGKPCKIARHHTGKPGPDMVA